MQIAGDDDGISVNVCREIRNVMRGRVRIEISFHVPEDIFTNISYAGLATNFLHKYQIDSYDLI